MSRATGAPPFDLHLDVVDRRRWFELVSPGFVGAEETGIGPCDGLRRTTYSPPAPHVAVRVSFLDGAEGHVLTGLASEDGDALLARLDPATGEGVLELRLAGDTVVLGRGRHLPRGGGELALVLNENRATLLLRDSVDVGVGPYDGWRVLASERRRLMGRVDLRDPAVLGRFHAAWGVEGGTTELGTGRAGLFGMAGLRDLHVVQHADGSLFTDSGGTAYLTATCAGLGFFRQAHWGVFSFDPDRPGSLRQTAHLYARRDGLVLGDHAGQLVRDGDRWLLAVSSWGDFSPDRGVHVRHLATADDLLHGVHRLETERTSLPTTVSAWDPGMARVDGRWFVSYVESPSQEPFEFHPALAATTADRWHEGLEQVGAAEGMRQCEGPVLTRVEGRWWLLASDGHAREYPVFDLAMNRVGSLEAPYGTNIPHPQVVASPSGGQSLWTFDGTQYDEHVLGYGSHGDVLVMRTVERPSAWALPGPRRVVGRAWRKIHAQLSTLGPRLARHIR